MSQTILQMSVSQTRKSKRDKFTQQTLTVSRVLASGEDSKLNLGIVLTARGDR